MENKKIFIGNLDFAATEEEIKTLLSGYGTVVTIKMHRKKGYAFIEMSNEAEAALAIEKLNGALFKDRKIRISLEIKASRAKALSIKKYNDRAEGFSRRKRSEKHENVSPDKTENDSMMVESNEPFSGLEGSSVDKENIISPKVSRRAKKRPAAQRSDPPYPQRKEWSHDRPAHSNRPSRDSRKSGYGRSPQPETNYNTRERWSDSGERPARNYSRGRSGSPHPQRKEWSHNRPAESNRPSRNDRKPGYGRSSQPEINYNTRERWPDSGERPERNYDRGRSHLQHPQRKEWSHNRPAESNRPSRNDRKPGYGRSPQPETNYNTRERWSDSGERPARNYSSGRSGSRPRPSGSSPNRFSPSSRPKSGSGGKNNSANSARPKARGGAGNRGRSSRPKRD